MDPRKKSSIKIQEDPTGEKHDLDQLSSLPDSIITHIFSFLDSDTVIRTSVLAKRYKMLWTLSSTLDFRLSEFIEDKFDFNEVRLQPVAKKPRVAAFESYVYRVLQLREHSNLVRFRLSLHKDVGLEFAQNCASYAAEHKVQHLRMRGFFYRKPLVFPDLLLNSPSLVSLNLRNATRNSIELPKMVSLPNLKVLCLKNFEFSDINYNGGLFLGCPNLETLVLHKCSIMPANKLKVLNVSCLNLKHLEIKRWRSPWRCFDEHVIYVKAPKLVSFKFEGHLVRMSFSEVLPCFERAWFDVFFPTACSMINARERKEKIAEYFLNMIVYLRNVKVISLSMKTIEVVSSIRDLCAHAPVVFEKLRIINFTVENKYGEKTFPVETVNRLLGKLTTDDLMFDGYKVKKVIPESSKPGCKRNNRHTYIPAHFMHFLLESSPAAEFLCLEIPDLSSDEE